MKVVRKDVYEFVVVLDEVEFKSIKNISDKLGKSIEAVLEILFGKVFQKTNTISLGK